MYALRYHLYVPRTGGLLARLLVLVLAASLLLGAVYVALFEIAPHSSVHAIRWWAVNVAHELRSQALPRRARGGWRGRLSCLALPVCQDITSPHLPALTTSKLDRGAKNRRRYVRARPQWDPPVWAVSLPSAVARREALVDMLEGEDLRYELVDGVDGEAEKGRMNRRGASQRPAGGRL